MSRIPLFITTYTQVNPPVRTEAYRVPRYRVSLVREGSIPLPAIARVSSSHDLAVWVRTSLTEDLDREAFFAVYLDAKNKIIGVNMVSLGSLSSSVVHPREVFKPAILLNASAMICFHNHPSGDPTPSRDDRDTTARISEAGKILGVRVLDHIVIGENDYYSFADAGAMP